MPKDSTCIMYVRFAERQPDEDAVQYLNKNVEELLNAELYSSKDEIPLDKPVSSPIIVELSGDKKTIEALMRAHDYLEIGAKVKKIAVAEVEFKPEDRLFTMK